MLKLLKRIFIEAWLPLLCALGYVFYQHFEIGKSWSDFIPIFSYAFFIVFFFQGQVLRIKKNIRDDEGLAVAGKTREGVESLGKALQEIRAMMISGGFAVNYPRTASVDVTLDNITASNEQPAAYSGPGDEYFIPAAKAIKSGLYYTGALTAAQGFESAIRDFAIKLDYPAEKRPSFRILTQLLDHVNSKILRDRLLLLLRTRNTLVHETRPNEIDQEEAIELAEMFEQGTNDLRAAIMK